MEKFLLISLKLTFTPYSFGFYGLINKKIESEVCNMTIQPFKIAASNDCFPALYFVKEDCSQVSRCCV